MTNNWFWHTVPAPKGSYNSDDTVVIHWGRIGLSVVGVIVALIFLFGSTYTVPAGNVGVVTWFGSIERTAGPGFHFKWPIAEAVTRMNIQTQLDQADAEAASSDLQDATATIAINYHLDPAYAALVYQTIGTGYKDTILTPMVQNSFKEATAAHTAEQLITQREAVRQAAEADIKTKALVYHIIVDNFQIVNFKFSDQYQQAIEQKQVAQQGVETQKQLLAQAQVKAQTAVADAQGVADSQVVSAKANAQVITINAQAQANANTILTQSLTPELLQYQYLQHISGVQTVFLPSGGNFILPLPGVPASK